MAMPFDGDTYDREQDAARLGSQLARVKALLVQEPGRRWTLAELAAEAGGSEASISARLRDLRKEKFGQYAIGRARREGGLWEYWIELGAPAPAPRRAAAPSPPKPPAKPTRRQRVRAQHRGELLDSYERWARGTHKGGSDG